MSDRGFYALPKDNTIESYQYTGVESLHTDYPSWMEGPVVDNFIETVRYNQSFMVNHIDPFELRPYGMDDIFICNKKGDVTIISDVKLLCDYVAVDGDTTLIGLQSDCIEAVIFDGAGYGDWDSYPRWLQQSLMDDTYYVDGVFMFNDFALCPGDIFLRNKQGHVRVMSQMDFDEFYYLAQDLLPF